MSTPAAVEIEKPGQAADFRYTASYMWPNRGALVLRANCSLKPPLVRTPLIAAIGIAPNFTVGSRRKSLAAGLSFLHSALTVSSRIILSMSCRVKCTRAAS